MNAQTEETPLAGTQRLIAELSPAAQKRVAVIAGILRELINAEDGGQEAELAFTLVLAERAEL